MTEGEDEDVSRDAATSEMEMHLPQQTEKDKREGYEKICRNLKSHGQVNSKCRCKKRDTCRKNGSWVGALGQSPFSETKEEVGLGNKTRNRPRRPDPTGGPDNGTKHQKRQPADTGPNHASEQARQEREPPGKPRTFTHRFLGST